MMRGPFILSLGLHAALAVAMIWASRPSEGERRPLPEATMVKLIRPKSMPSSSRPQLPPKDESDIPVPESKPPLELPDKSKAKKDDVEEPVKEPLKVPDPDAPRKTSTEPAHGSKEGVEFHGKFGTMSFSGTGFADGDPYLGYIQGKLDQNFRPPPGMRSGATATVAFTIEKNGRISKVGLVKGSGNRLVDMAAERAIRAAGQFPPLPPQFSGQGQLTISVEFAVNTTAGG